MTAHCYRMNPYRSIDYCLIVFMQGDFVFCYVGDRSSYTDHVSFCTFIFFVASLQRLSLTVS